MHGPTRHYSRVENISPDPEQQQIGTPSSSSDKHPSMKATPRKIKLMAVMIMILPLVSQAAISVIITFILLVPFDQSRYFLERHPKVTLADGTSVQLQGYHLLQSDITTFLSVVLVLLRWIAAAWAGPLCWRVICLLGESHGVRRRDIRWASSRGVLPPGTHLRHPLALVLGIILLISVVPQALSPLLTGSIMWEPSSLHSNRIPGNLQPTVNITGLEPGDNSGMFARFYNIDFSITLLRNYMIAWGTSHETDGVSKRVVDSIAGLSINSTLTNVTLSHLRTAIEWYEQMPSEIEKMLNSSFFASISDAVPHTKFQSGVVWVTPVPAGISESSWYFAFGAEDETRCQPDNYIQNLTKRCYYTGRISYSVSTGYCVDCRVSSEFVVQNDTSLHSFGGNLTYAEERALSAMPQQTPDMRRLVGSLPTSRDDRAVFVQTFLFRVYSALWNTYTDISTFGFTRLKSGYSPAFPGLMARVDTVRVLLWLGAQLAATCAGLVFLYLQLRSKHPLMSDTTMIAFDMDSSDAPKPGPHDKFEPKALLKIEPNGDGWKAVVVDG